jgi:HEAT repeat protein
MNSIAELLNDKSLKPKQKTETISKGLLNGTIAVDALIEFAKTAKDSPQATCLEALELATHSKPELVNEKVFDFVVKSLAAKAPRVKWESAKVIGNTASLHQKNLGDAISNLLTNTEHEGTVVRWAAAFALGEIIKLKTKHNAELLSAIDAIILREEKNSIKKIYQAALKKK